MTRFLVLFLLAATYAYGQSNKKAVKLEFDYQFRILDFLSIISKIEIINNYFYSIQFMERATGIDAETSGDFLGKFICYKIDLNKWHKRYENKYIYDMILKFLQSNLLINPVSSGSLRARQRSGWARTGPTYK